MFPRPGGQKRGTQAHSDESADARAEYRCIHYEPLDAGVAFVSGVMTTYYNRRVTIHTQVEADDVRTGGMSFSSRESDV